MPDDTHFRPIEVDLPDGTTTNVTIPAEAPPPAPTPAGVVSKPAAARILRDKAALLAKGYTMHGTEVYAIGTRVNATGDENLTRRRLAHDAKPLALDGLSRLAQVIRAEDRQVTEGIPLAFIRAVGDGLALGFTDRGEPASVVVPTGTALKHLADFLAPGAGLTAYLPQAPLPVRAAAIEAHARQVLGDRLVHVAHRLERLAPAPGTWRRAYRFASPGYAPFEVGPAVEALLGDHEVREALQGARLEAQYDGERATLDLTWHADRVVDLACGDVFKTGIRVKLNDVKGGAVEVWGTAWRNLCLNLIIIGTAGRCAFRQRHAGTNAEAIRSLFLAAVRGVRRDFDGFITRWGDARRDRILDGFDGNATTVFQGLVAAGLVNVPGTAAQKVERLVAAWQAEPGPTRADLVNAVTRAAHAGTGFADVEGYQAVEAQGSQLLYTSALAQRVRAGLAAWQDRAS